jgi:hypothetical protein
MPLDEAFTWFASKIKNTRYCAVLLKKINVLLFYVHLSVYAVCVCVCVSTKARRGQLELHVVISHPM